VIHCRTCLHCSSVLYLSLFRYGMASLHCSSMASLYFMAILHCSSIWYLSSGIFWWYFRISKLNSTANTRGVLYNNVGDLKAGRH
jgi:hypothetical protein